MENVGKKPDVARIPLTFDCSDETQRMVCNLLKSAGYGKRTPIVVKAICLLMGRANSAEDGGNAAVSDEKLSALMYLSLIHIYNAAQRAVSFSVYGGDAAPFCCYRYGLCCTGVSLSLIHI